MKKLKKLLYLFLFISLVYIVTDNVDAQTTYSCDGSSTDTCEKRTYKYAKDGTTKDFSMTIGVYHFKNTDPNNLNIEYIISFDNCAADNNTKYCSTNPYRFDTITNQATVAVSSSSNTFPDAICVLPYNGGSPLNQQLTDDNAKNYVYFSNSEVESAINNGYCLRENVFYSEEASESTSSTKVCDNPSVIHTFQSTEDLTNATIVTNDYTEGTSTICSIRLNKNSSLKYTYNHRNSGLTCSSASYTTTCSGSGSSYSCNISSCSNASSAVVGNKCDLTNTSNSSDKLVLAYTFQKDNVGAYFNSLKRNGTMVSDPIQLGQEEYALSSTCPTYVIYIKDDSGTSSTGYKYVVLTSENHKSLYERENPGVEIITTYRLDNSSDISDLTEDEVVDSIYKPGIDWSDPVTSNCEGIIGTELLELINKVFRWIQIIAPIVVIVMGAVEFGGAVLQDDKDALKKASNKFVKRLIIAVALFFIPLILSFVLNIFNEVSGSFVSTCGIGE